MLLASLFLKMSRCKLDIDYQYDMICIYINRYLIVKSKLNSFAEKCMKTKNMKCMHFSRNIVNAILNIKRYIIFQFEIKSNESKETNKLKTSIAVLLKLNIEAKS